MTWGISNDMKTRSRFVYIALLDTVDSLYYSFFAGKEKTPITIPDAGSSF